MALAIIAVTAFQAYWLKENYKREKTSLELKTGTDFRKAVLGLQANKLRIQTSAPDSLNVFNLERNGKNQSSFNIRIEEGEELAGYINNVTTRIHDSGLNSKGKKEKVVVTMKTPAMNYWQDSTKEIHITRDNMNGNRIVRFLYSVDSLQDSIHVKEIDSVFGNALLKNKMDIPFSIHRNEFENIKANEKDPMMVRVGLAHPVIYQLELGNTYPYLLRQLATPILFSLFLVGITLFSFIMLYRNLLQQKRLAAIKNEFISNITHELKTPIATVGVAIEALRNFNAIENPQRTKEYLDISQNELQRLSLLVDKVLKLSMFENKEIDLKVETIDMKGVVEEVVSSMKLQIEKHKATVSVNTEGNTQVMGDQLHLLSVVFNLLDNSLKYGNGNTKVDISLKEKDKDLELIVADNGIGIAAEFKDKLFEKFFRVPAGDTHNAKGYGLGLSYVAHVVKKHNGRIEVESQVGQGTRFIILLPKKI